MTSRNERTASVILTVSPRLGDEVYAFWYSDDPVARWEPMFEAQGILNRERPIILLAGENSLQAFRNERFDFPFDTCDVSLGMFSTEGLLNGEVK